MAIRIDAAELIQVLTMTPPTQNIMLLGKHGIGKSDIIRQHYELRRMPVAAFFLGQMSDPGDLIGLMHNDATTGRAEFLPPYWWPEQNRPMVLFLDELNRARPEILQSVQDLTLNRTLAGKRLPEGSIVIAAVNEGEEYQLTDLDPALVSRFNLYDFQPSVEDWVLWADAHGVDVRIIQFIQKNSQYLDGDTHDLEAFTVSSALVKSPDRRAWVKVSDFIQPFSQLDALHIKIIAGMVGTPAALLLKQHLGTTGQLSVEDLLLAFPKQRSKLKALPLQDLVLLNGQIMRWLNARQFEGKDQSKVLKHFLAYIKYLQKAKQREAVAHLASMLENPSFETAMGFLAGSMEIIGLLTDYIEGIRVE